MQHNFWNYRSKDSIHQPTNGVKSIIFWILNNVEKYNVYTHKVRFYQSVTGSRLYLSVYLHEWSQYGIFNTVFQWAFEDGPWELDFSSSRSRPQLSWYRLGTTKNVYLYVNRICLIELFWFYALLVLNNLYWVITIVKVITVQSDDVLGDP